MNVREENIYEDSFNDRDSNSQVVSKHALPNLFN